MPKRQAFGTSLGLFSRLANQVVRRPANASKGLSAVRRACVDVLEPRTLMSTTYFVSPNGSDYGSGSFNQPYKTIQEAANVANWGDTVSIEAGTYHETVTPAHSGVTFTNYNGQQVTVSGANPLGNWSSAGGSTYQAWASSLGEGNNQVFVDGSAVPEARWPSTSYQSQIGSYSNGVIYDNNLQQSNGFWNGAVIHITPGDGWVSYAGTVNNSGPGWVQVSLPSLSQYEQPSGGNSYSLTGTRNALSGNNQFYMSPSGQVLLNDPNGDNPAWHDVEIKARQYAFDISNVSNTTIQGLNVFAATIHSGWSSTNTVINGITAYYITQFNNQWNSGWSPPAPNGIELNGSGSVLENSTIGGSAGDGVFIGTTNVTVNNNTIHDVDTSGTDAAGVRTYSSNDTITNNTIYNTGRDGINFHAGSETITGNTIHDFMQLDNDGAGIYTVNTNGNGTTIAYNTVYNGHNGNTNGLDDIGIMLDNDSSNFNVHNNTTWNVDAGFKANNTSYNEQVYNNTFGGNQYAIESNGWVGYAYDWGGSNVHDNLFNNPNLKLGANIGNWNNSFGNSAPSSPPASPPPVAPPPPAPASPPPAPAPTPTSATATASLLNTDTTTGGNWSTYYGADGYSAFTASAAFPSYAQFNPSGYQTYTWASNPNDWRALQTTPGSGNRVAACAYTSSSMTFDLNLTDGKTHQVALSLLDYDRLGRSETVQVQDAGTGTVLNSQNVSNFGNGTDLVWNLSGHVKIVISCNTGPNAVASGIFFGGGTGSSNPTPASPPPAGTAATLKGTDTTTGGTWTGAYGSNGYSVVDGSTNLPSYTQVSTSNAQTYVWNGSTGDGRAVQTSSGSGSRVAATNYSASSFTYDVNLTDGNSHQVAIYLLDWDNLGRSETVQVKNASTGGVLDSENVSNFSKGEYLVWNVSGHVDITVTKVVGPNGVASGLFFAPAT